jgi:hypothetical protein
LEGEPGYDDVVKAGLIAGWDWSHDPATSTRMAERTREVKTRNHKIGNFSSEKPSDLRRKSLCRSFTFYGNELVSMSSPYARILLGGISRKTQMFLCILMGKNKI